MGVPEGFERVTSEHSAFRWLKKNHLEKAHIVEVRIGYGPQTLYYWRKNLIAQAPRKNEKRSKSSLAAAQEKRAELFAWIDAQDIPLPDCGLERLARVAIAHRNHYRSEYRDRDGFSTGEERHDFDSFDYTPGCETTEHVRRWIFNYLRHEESEYNNQLAEMFGKVGKAEGRERLQQRIQQLAIKKWPALGDPLYRGTGSKA